MVYEASLHHLLASCGNDDTRVILKGSKHCLHAGCMIAKVFQQFGFLQKKVSADPGTLPP